MTQHALSRRSPHPTGHSVDLPATISGNRVSRIREPCVHSSCTLKLRSPIPDVNGQRLYYRGFPYREIGTYERSRLPTFQNPECRCAMPRAVLHAVSVGPVATRGSSLVPPCSLRLRKRRSAESRLHGISCHLSLR
jgi:hypothetical protein